MDRDDIIRMAREAGFKPHHSPEMWDITIASDEAIERFAALVTAAKDAEHHRTLAHQQRSYEREIQLEVEAERERCLRLIDEHVRAVDAEDVVRAIREAKE